MENNEYEHLPYRYYNYSTTLFLKQSSNKKKLNLKKIEVYGFKSFAEKIDNVWNGLIDSSSDMYYKKHNNNAYYIINWNNW